MTAASPSKVLVLKLPTIPTWPQARLLFQDGVGLARALSFEPTNSSLWKRVVAWERSRAASGYGIIWVDADRSKQEEFSAECHRVD